MARIPEAEIERLKNEVAMERLVESSGIKLRKSGKDLLSKCPFHQDDTASLVVTSAKDLWHCFGCGVGGGPIDWVMKLRGISFCSYNPQGQRTRKFSSTGSASTTLFIYSQDGLLLGEYTHTGTPIREYVWVNSTPVAIFTPNGTNPPNIYYVHADHLDTPRIITDRSGNGIRWRWLAEPFGTTAPETNPAGLGAFTQNLRFPGQYSDSESGLFYNYFRNYDCNASAAPAGTRQIRNAG